MKNLTYLLVFSLLLFYGCSEKQNVTPSTESQQVEKSGISAWILNNDGDSPVWELTTLPEQQSSTDYSDLKKSKNSAHTHGNFDFLFWSITFSGTQNNGGTHGNADADFLMGPPYNVTVQIHMETECVMVDGNKAVYGGTFTEVLNNPLPPGYGPFEVGNILYFKVVDNGQGNNAQPDQHSIEITILPAGNSFCGVFPPSSPFWGFTIDVLEPGSIKVN